MDKDKLEKDINATAEDARIMDGLIHHKGFEVFQLILGKNLRRFVEKINPDKCGKCETEKFLTELGNECQGIVNKSETSETMAKGLK
jgi:hypothetical protein